MNEDRIAKMKLLGKSCLNCVDGYIYTGDTEGKCGNNFKFSKYGNNNIPENDVCGFWSFIDPNIKKLLIRNKTKNYNIQKDNITDQHISDAVLVLNQLKKLDIDNVLKDKNKRIIKDENINLSQ